MKRKFLGLSLLTALLLGTLAACATPTEEPGEEPAITSPAAEPGGVLESPAAEPGGVLESPAAEPGGVLESPAAEPGGALESPAAEPGGDMGASPAASPSPGATE